MPLPLLLDQIQSLDDAHGKLHHANNVLHKLCSSDSNCTAAESYDSSESAPLLLPNLKHTGSGNLLNGDWLGSLLKVQHKLDNTSQILEKVENEYQNNSSAAKNALLNLQEDKVKQEDVDDVNTQTDHLLKENPVMQRIAGLQKIIQEEHNGRDHHDHPDIKLVNPPSQAYRLIAIRSHASSDDPLMKVDTTSVVKESDNEVQVGVAPPSVHVNRFTDYFANPDYSESKSNNTTNIIPGGGDSPSFVGTRAVSRVEPELIVAHHTHKSSPAQQEALTSAKDTLWSLSPTDPTKSTDSSHNNLTLIPSDLMAPPRQTNCEMWTS